MAELHKDRKYQTLCPVCEQAWGVPVDEDGCCNQCGAPAYGDGVDTVAAELTALREKVGRLEDALDALESRDGN